MILIMLPLHLITSDWDERHLVVFHLLSAEDDDNLGDDSCTIHVWDIGGNEPRFLYAVHKDINAMSMFVNNGHVVVAPVISSLNAHALVMALDINDQMSEAGKLILPDEERDMQLDDKRWVNTEVQLLEDEALVVFLCHRWHLIVVELPSCHPLYQSCLSDVSIHDYKSCMILVPWTNKHMAMLCFTRVQNASTNMLVTVDVSGAGTSLRSCHPCDNMASAALVTDPEEVLILKYGGDITTYDANEKQEVVKIPNEDTSAADAVLNDLSAVNQEYLDQIYDDGEPEYQFSVKQKKQICLMQSSPFVSQGGRYVRVYTYPGCEKLYTINLGLCRHRMSPHKSVVMYNNGTFLATATCKTVAIFCAKTGRHLNCIEIQHLHRFMGKEEADCTLQQGSLISIKFVEEKLIAVHDYERR